jgi:hypothetical protein
VKKGKEEERNNRRMRGKEGEGMEKGREEGGKSNNRK